MNAPVRTSPMGRPKTGIALPAVLIFILSCMALRGQDHTVEYKAFGFRFLVPGGWTGREQEGIYTMTGPAVNTAAFIKTLPWSNPDEIRVRLAKGVAIGTDMFLVPAMDLAEHENGFLEGRFSGMSGRVPVLAYAVILRSRNRQTVMVVAAASRETYDDSTAAMAWEIAESFEFFPPEMPSLRDEYLRLVENTRLMHSVSDAEAPGTGSGEQAQVIIDLCGNGHFIYFETSPKTDSGGMVVFGGGLKGAGTWEITDGKGKDISLVLHFANNDTLEYAISYINGKLFLNGELFLRIGLRNGACQ